MIVQGKFNYNFEVETSGRIRRLLARFGLARRTYRTTNLYAEMARAFREHADASPYRTATRDEANP